MKTVENIAAMYSSQVPAYGPKVVIFTVEDEESKTEDVYTYTQWLVEKTANGFVVEVHYCRGDYVAGGKSVVADSILEVKEALIAFDAPIDSWVKNLQLEIESQKSRIMKIEEDIETKKLFL